MRFVWAVAAFILAAIMIGAGIAQRTVFFDPRAADVVITPAEGTPYLVIDGAVLNDTPGTQTISVQTSGGAPAVVSYGRTVDVMAWASDAPFEHVTLDSDGAVAQTIVLPDAGGSGSMRNPAGSDLWLGETAGTGLVEARMSVPASMSVIVAGDGSGAAPGPVTLSWPVRNLTPWAGPLIFGGIVVLIAGLVLYFLGLRHSRRSKGPRRKGPPPLPPTEPLQTITSSAAPTRRSLSGARTKCIALTLPALVTAGALLAGCAPDLWPQQAGSATPVASESVTVPEGEQAPAVTKGQATAILQRIADTVAQADAAGDADLAATRLSGAMLDERRANYTIRGKLPEQAARPAIPTQPLQLVLPQALDTWPRNVMMIVADPSKTDDTPTIAVMTQADQWSPYTLSYLSNLAPAAAIPDVAPVELGARLVPPDSPFLLIAPGQLAAAYADILANGDQSSFAADFDLAADPFRIKVTENRDASRAKFNETGAETGTIEFASSAGPYESVALATLESGAIVAVSVIETETARPTSDDASIKLDDNPQVQALTGTSSSSKGFETSYSDQLFFYVPNKGSGERISLLAFNSYILNAKALS